MELIEGLWILRIRDGRSSLEPLDGFLKLWFAQYFSFLSLINITS